MPMIGAGSERTCGCLLTRPCSISRVLSMFGPVGHANGEIQLPNCAEVMQDFSDHFSIWDHNAGMISDA